ncbi:MAG: hypothetical protein QM783_04875 [Phycisphaerales bacterium]
MLWWFVGGFIALIGLRLLFQRRHGLLPRPTESPHLEIHDARLGRLTYCPDAKSWECNVQLADGTAIELSINGPKSGPDPAAVNAARQLADRGPELIQSIQRLVAAAAATLEQAKDPAYAAERAEMLSLVVDGIHIFSAGPPLSCMVSFKENPSHIGVWRCGYDGERVFDFGVDR